MKQNIIRIVTILFLSISSQLMLAQADGEALEIGTYRKLHSEVLNKDRLLLVQLPDDYESTDKEYPVIIKLFGTHPEYFAHINSTLDMLSSRGLIPPAIFIGVDQHGHGEVIPPMVPSTQYPHEGDKFLRFVKNELIPFIDENYRTNKFRILMGSFDCGLFGLYSLVNEPELFNVYLINSPDRYGGSSQFLENIEGVIDSLDLINRFLNISYGAFEPEAIRQSTQKLIDYFEQKTPKGLLFSTNYLENPDHDGLRPYIYCKGSMLNIFHGYTCPAEIAAKGLDSLESYYNRYSEKLGYQIEIPVRTLDHSGNSLLGAGRLDEAEEVFKKMIQEYPNSIEGYFRMADLTHFLERYKESAAYYQKCLDFNPNIDIARIRKKQVEDLINR